MSATAPFLLVMDNNIRHAAATAAISTLPLADTLVVVVIGLGVFGDNVPRVQKAGDVAQDAKKNVDYGISGTNTAFDPDYKES